jgi:[ribosomal protein S18]-alanine N-acetyltransferase
MTISIRAITLSDLSAIAELDKAVFPEQYYNPIVWRQLFDVTPTTILGAWDDHADAPVGYSLGVPSILRHAWILALGVNIHHRRLGIGRRLTVELMALLMKGGQRTVGLTVSPANTNARALYSSIGFHETGFDPEYFGQGEPRIVMETPLTHVKSGD